MKKIFDKIKALDKGTKVRTLLMMLAYVNQLIAVIGGSTFAASPVYQWISFGITVVISAISYWYNNDWTSFAMMSRDIFDMLEDGKVEPAEVETFINEHKNDKETVKKEENKE